MLWHIYDGAGVCVCLCIDTDADADALVHFSLKSNFVWLLMHIIQSLKGIRLQFFPLLHHPLFYVYTIFSERIHTILW